MGTIGQGVSGRGAINPKSILSNFYSNYRTLIGESLVADWIAKSV